MGIEWKEVAVFDIISFDLDPDWTPSFEEFFVRKGQWKW